MPEERVHELIAQGKERLLAERNRLAASLHEEKERMKRAQEIAAHLRSVLAGRPVLVGTTSVEKSDRLSQMLMRRHGIEHEVLNAKHHEREAEIVALAGLETLSPSKEKKDLTDKIIGAALIRINIAFITGPWAES